MPRPSPDIDAGREPGTAESDRLAMTSGGFLFDLSAIDFSARMHDRTEIERRNPHRGAMNLLDWIVYQHPDRLRGVALRHVRADEFWVPGHFPQKPMLPGVLMVEAGAQLACYLFMLRQPGPRLVAFLRIEHAAFRSPVVPGDDFYLLCEEVKVGRRQFKCDIQGMVNRRPTFEARVSGMMT